MKVKLSIVDLNSDHAFLWNIIEVSWAVLETLDSFINFFKVLSLASLSAGQYVSYYTSPVTSYYHNYNGLYSGFSPRLVRPLTHRTVAAPSIVRNIITEPNSPGAKAALSYLSEGSGLDSCGQTTKVNNWTWGNIISLAFTNSWLTHDEAASSKYYLKICVETYRFFIFL